MEYINFSIFLVLAAAARCHAAGLRASSQTQPQSPSPHHTHEEWRRLTTCDSRCENPGATGKPLTGLTTKYLQQAVQQYMEDPNSSPYGNVINCWNVKGQNTLQAMFSSTTFDERLDCWDVSNVQKFNNLFDGATRFNQDISGWDVQAHGQFFQQMFQNAKSFNQDLCQWYQVSNQSQNRIADMFDGSGCEVKTDPVSGQVLNSWCQHCFGEYNGKWENVGSNAQQSFTAGASWSQSEGTTYSESFTASMTMSAEESIEFDGTGAKTTESATVSAQTSVSNTISYASSHSWSYTCNSPTCDNGVLFQWVVEANQSDGTTQNVKTCNFECVPQSIPNGRPMCPLNFCSDNTCQCCNSDWIYGDSDPTNNHLEKYNGNGGTCTSFCVGNDQPCEDTVTCCSGQCSVSGICEQNFSLEQDFRF